MGVNEIMIEKEKSIPTRMECRGMVEVSEQTDTVSPLSLRNQIDH